MVYFRNDLYHPVIHSNKAYVYFALVSESLVNYPEDFIGIGTWKHFPCSENISKEAFLPANIY